MMLKPGMFLQERYEILDQIGSGGMSEVYRAKCHKLNRLVAIKVLKEEFSQDSNFVSKFKMEAQSAAGLSHPNIVSIYDVVDEDTLHYIVMEVIEGITLKSYIMKKGHLGVKESIGIAIQVAQGVGAAHDQHIIHRDIKPQNMIISKDGKVKVADFGIARAVSSQTVGSTAVGSVHYISPEQARGGYSDARSDIYSLGITIYEMVTGQVPYDGENAVTIALAHLEKPIIPPHCLNPEVTPSLERIILKCTQKKPERRYHDAYELIGDLRRALVDPDDDSMKKNVEMDTSSPTVIISEKDLTKINTPQVLDVEENKTNQSRVKKNNAIDDVNPHIEKILTTVGIIAAVIIVIVVVVIVGQLGGVFNRGSGNSKFTVAAQETEVALKSTECRVPELKGMNIDDAEAALKELSLVPKYEYQASSDEEQGLVIGQSVTSGTVVVKQTILTLIIGEGSGKINLTKLNLESLKGEDAAKLLTEQKLVVTVTAESSDTIEKDYVLRYEPQLAAPGDPITLYVSSGPAVPSTKVPNLSNMTPKEAKVSLEALMLVLGTATEEKSDSVAKGSIINQSIAPGSDAPQGTAVNYTISIGKGKNYISVVNDDYPLKDMFGPSSGDTQLMVQIVMKQEVNGKEVEKTIMEPRVMGGDITIPIHYKIQGADGVLTGRLEIVDLTNSRILKTYQLEFLEVDE
ncbi:MAG: Stk1 family PASTA domain-containing Ser/Thr kinase [Clostridium sp.]